MIKLGITINSIKLAFVSNQAHAFSTSFQVDVIYSVYNINYFVPLEDKSKLVKKQTTLFYCSLNPVERFVFSDV